MELASLLTLTLTILELLTLVIQCCLTFALIRLLAAAEVPLVLNRANFEPPLQERGQPLLEGEHMHACHYSTSW